MASSKRKFDHSVPARIPKKPRSENADPSYGQPSQGVPEPPHIHPRFERAVFTHCSSGEQRPEDSTLVNYERLEFLGDAQLEHIASLVIFERYNSATPGKMSTVRESLLRNRVLCDFSRAYGFDKKLRIGKSPSEITPDHLTKIHADVFEAYVAAVILSDDQKGFDTARTWLTSLWEPMLAVLNMSVAAPKDVKSKEDLARAVLVKGIKLNYVEERAPLPLKAQGLTKYFMGVYLTGWGYDNHHMGSGDGPSKLEAGQVAARNALANSVMDDIRKKRTEYLAEKEKQEQVAEGTSANG